MTTTEIDYSIENKTTEQKKIMEQYFKSADKDSYKVTFLLIVGEENTPNMLDKIFIRSQEALSEIKPIHPQSNESKNEFVLKNDIGSLKLKVRSVESDYKKESVWEVRIEGDFELLEEYRTQFLKQINNYCITKYCIEDEISDVISITAYPIIREMENTLREYLVRFFSKKFGSKWWEKNTTQALKAKAAERKKSGGGISNLLNMEIYNIDFHELLILLNGQFGQTDSDAIIGALDALVRKREDEDAFDEKILELKNRFLGNWEKFFGQEIRIDNFMNDWKEMYEVRCEVAHNSLLTLKRFIKLTDLHAKLKANLEKLIGEQRIIKSSEYLMLEQIQKLKIRLTKTDVDNIINDRLLVLSSINFGSETISLEVFNEHIQSLTEDVVLFGEVNISSVQLSDVGEGDEEQRGRPSVNVRFSEIPIDVIEALKLGLTLNKFN